MKNIFACPSRNIQIAFDQMSYYICGENKYKTQDILASQKIFQLLFIECLFRHVLFLLQWAMTGIQLILLEVKLNLDVSFYIYLVYQCSFYFTSPTQYLIYLGPFPQSSISRTVRLTEIFNKSMEPKELLLQDIQNSSFEDSIQDSILDQLPQSATTSHPLMHHDDFGHKQVLVQSCQC